MEKTHQLPISVMIKERRLRWLGHAARRSDNNIVKQLLFATRIPGHVQPVGRPCGTWMHYAMRDVKDMDYYYYRINVLCNNMTLNFGSRRPERACMHMHVGKGGGGGAHMQHSKSHDLIRKWLHLPMTAAHHGMAGMMGSYPPRLPRRIAWRW